MTKDVFHSDNTVKKIVKTTEASATEEIHEIEETDISLLAETILQKLESFITENYPDKDSFVIYDMVEPAIKLWLTENYTNEITDITEIKAVSKKGISLTRLQILLIKKELDMVTSLNQKQPPICELRQKLVDELIMLVEFERSKFDVED